MASVNRPIKLEKIYTHGGTQAVRITPEAQLRRSVLSCLLWENEFYEDGQSIAERINEYANRCSKEIVANLAVEARHTYGLRHVPLLLLLNLISRPKEEGPSTKNIIAKVIRRPDEMMELVALYWKDKKKPLAKQLQRGLALAFQKFDEYSLAKYNRDNAIKLRDVLFLSHAKPKDGEQTQLFKRVANNALKTPLTWETRLSGGEKALDVWTEMLKNTLNPDYKDRDNSLGYLALLRNLRNMEQAGVNRKLMEEAILLRKGADLVFPFRYVAAARACPQMEGVLDKALVASIEKREPLKGETIVMVDCSGSMRRVPVSARSDIDRVTAAATLASMISSERLRVFSFANDVREVPARRGMAGVDAIVRSNNGGTALANAIDQINKLPHDRLIVITDEQDTTGRKIPDPVCQWPYMINVASYRNGIGYGSWIHLDGFSESILRFISEFEKSQ